MCLKSLSTVKYSTKGCLLINVIDVFLAKEMSFIHPFDFYYGQINEHNIHPAFRHVNYSVKKNNVQNLDGVLAHSVLEQVGKHNRRKAFLAISI